MTTSTYSPTFLQSPGQLGWPQQPQQQGFEQVIQHIQLVTQMLSYAQQHLWTVTQQLGQQQPHQQFGQQPYQQFGQQPYQQYGQQFGQQQRPYGVGW